MVILVAEAAGRAGKCREPEILAAGRSPAVPLLWSRELRRSQESFVNEKPFLTRKFDPFLEQLPETSRLRDTWHDGGRLTAATNSCLQAGVQSTERG